MQFLGFTKTATSYRGWVAVVRSTGALRTGAVAGDFTVTIVDPADSTSTTTSVTESTQKPGLYYFDVSSVFLTANGVGSYGITVEVDITTSPKVTDSLGAILKVTSQDLDDLAVPGDEMDLLTATIQDITDDILDEPVALHQSVGTVGRNLTSIAAETTALVGSTSTTLRTGLTQADGFFDNMQVTVVGASGTVTRNVDAYRQTNGEIDLEALPFVPSSGDPVLILRRTGSVPVDSTAIATEVWSTALPGAFAANSAGERLATTDDRVDVAVSTRAAPGDQMDLAPATITGLVDDVWDEPVSGHQTAGTFGRNATSIATETAATGGSATTIQTNLTEADGFYDNMQVVVINSAGTAVRNIDAYRQTNGEIDVVALPFTPSASDPVIILRRTGSVPADAASIATAVWDEATSSHTTAGTYGVAANTVAQETTAQVGSTSTTIRTSLTEADGFYTGMIVTVVNSSGTATRGINQYRQANGEIDVDALPFTPATSDPVIIHRRVQGVGASAAAIADAVWDETLADHAIVGSTGEALADAQAGGGGGGGSTEVVVLNGLLYNFNDFTATVATPNSGSAAARRIDISVDTNALGSGKIYIDTDLSFLYIEFGTSTVDADATSYRLYGGGPWAVATRGYEYISVYATADIPITIWGLDGTPDP